MSKISTPLNEQTFVLEKTDDYFKNEGDPTTVTIAQAGKIENNKRLRAWKQYARIYGSNRQIKPAGLRIEEVFLTLKGCNITDLNGQMLFKFPLDKEIFYESWCTLPLLVSDEIHEKVIQANPTWTLDEHSSFLRSLSSDQNDPDLRTAICPHCDHHQGVIDNPDHEDFEIYDGELEDWEWEEDGLRFVVTCNLCGQPYKMLSNHIGAIDKEGEEDAIDEDEDEADEQDFRFLDPDFAPQSNDRADFVYHYSDLGIKFAELKHFKKAEAAFRRVLAYDPTNEQAFSWLGYILEEENRLEEAEVAYRAAIRLQPSAEHNYSNLGVLLMNQGRFREADVAFVTGIKINPKEVAIYFNFGHSLIKQNRLKEAELVFRKLLEIAPNDETAKAKLNDLLSRKK